MNHLTIEVCFSPALIEHLSPSGNLVVVVVDVLRASTSIVSAIANGAKSVIPVSSLERAMKFKKMGYPVAAERDGKVLSFADFGNSAFEFMNGAVAGEKLVFSTTNGTVAVDKAKDLGLMALGAFTNLSALAQWIGTLEKNVLVLCSGWKNNFCLEDSIFAGALIGELMTSGKYAVNCDSAHAAFDLWQLAKEDLAGYLEKALHRQRLRKLGVDDVLEFSLTLNSQNVIPVYRDGEFVDAGIMKW